MRNRIGWVVLLVVSMVLFGVVQAFSGPAKNGNDCFGEETYQLKPPEGVQAKRGAVKFPHQAHFDFACVKCHHTFDGSDAPMGCATSGCHDAGAAPIRTGKSASTEDMSYFKNAYHQTCWLGCHKELRTKNTALQKAAAAQGTKAKLIKTGPTTCDGCHGKTGKAK
jgi:hypothetical protein